LRRSERRGATAVIGAVLDDGAGHLSAHDFYTAGHLDHSAAHNDHHHDDDSASDCRVAQPR